MPRYVSVPEKTLEHWTSQYISNRFSTRAALWWPVTGEDIDVGHLPARSGKAVQLEVKTTTVTGARIHQVLVDLGQLEEYRQRRLGHQPFYVFPWPDWHGKLEDDAAAWGPPVTELAFSRSGPGWWFADWMVAMTTQQVATLLDAELEKHGSTERGKTKPLVRFEVTISGVGRKRETKATWGPGKKKIDPPPVIHWADLWTELKGCGRPGWPQLIRLPAWLVRDRASYSHEQLAWALRNSTAEISHGQQRGELPLVTLEPDDNGNYFHDRTAGDEPVGRRPSPAGRRAEDHRTVVFLDASEIVPEDKAERR
ncbi:MAG TPA: hypothetical protein VF933_35470 [Streptosporangiaceae bacterium]